MEIAGERIVTVDYGYAPTVLRILDRTGLPDSRCIFTDARKLSSADACNTDDLGQHGGPGIAIVSMPAVHVFSVSNMDNEHQQMIILYHGQNAVISYPVPPELPQLSLKLTANHFGVRGDSFSKK